MANRSKDEEIAFLFTCLENSKGLDLPAVVRALNLPNLKSAQNKLYSLKVKYNRPGVQPKTPSKDNSAANVIANGDGTRLSPTKRAIKKDVLSPVKPMKVTKGKGKKDVMVVDLPESPTKVEQEQRPVKVERMVQEEDSDSEGGY